MEAAESRLVVSRVWGVEEMGETLVKRYKLSGISKFWDLMQGMGTIVNTILYT